MGRAADPSWVLIFSLIIMFYRARECKVKAFHRIVSQGRIERQPAISSDPNDVGILLFKGRIFLGVNQCFFLLSARVLLILIVTCVLTWTVLCVCPFVGENRDTRFLGLALLPFLFY